MLACKNVTLGICIFAAFIVMGKTTGFAEPLNSISKSSCVGCGCKYERDCDANSCWISCQCSFGPQADCMDKKSVALSGVTVSKSPNMTNYRIPETSKPDQAPVQNEKAH
jgi:hypothetical protein